MTDVLLWQWGRQGAAAKFTAELASELHSLGPKVMISSAAGSDLSALAKTFPRAVANHVIYTFEGDKYSLRGKLAASWALTRLPLITFQFHSMLARHNVALALCTFQSIWDAATLPVLWRSPTRFVLILHDVVLHPGDSYPFRYTVLRRQIGLSDALIVLSDHVKREVIERFDYPADRIWSMPHGAFKFGTKPITAATHPRGSRPLRLLFLGRIMAYKGLDRLLQARRLLMPRTAVDLTIAGVGSLKPYTALLDDSTEIHNHWLNDEEIADLLAACDVVVLPYIEASQSGVAGSAYAAGRPVVAMPIGGLVEQVIPHTTGILAQSVSAKALADAIQEFVENPALFDHCAHGALAYAQGSLSWQHSAQTVKEMIGAVTALPRRSAPAV